ncbi:MAG TPA: RNA polymerase sigma factor [Candidatus Methylacidiphilales bacterium]|jgi:RNA polymerase sigma-70 factor (ECF subfamily)|nr:RNA polymerase sigma factor [Candidatus Methylacidiphilales bacterium]
MDETLDVKGCLRRWKEGDESAAEELIRHLHPVISKIVRIHLPRRDDESDLVQEILMKTFSRLHQYKGDAPISHWVSRLALTTCLDRLRAQKIRPEIRHADLTPEDSDVFDAAWLTGSTPDGRDAIAARDLVDKILSSLSAEDRSLILMVDLEGRSLQEISETTGWSVSKIKMRLFRVRPQLRQMIQKLEKQK